MATAQTKQAEKQSKKRIGDMTADELRDLIRETVREVLLEMADEDFDPDEGLEFKPEVAEYLRVALKEKRRGTPLEEVLQEMGLNLDD